MDNNAGNSGQPSSRWRNVGFIILIIGGLSTVTIFAPQVLNITIFPNENGENGNIPSENLDPEFFFLNITLIIDYDNGTILEENNCGVEKNEPNIENLLRRYHEIEIQAYSFGNLVLSIDGISESTITNHFWFFWVNGTLAGTSADKVIIGTDTLVRWQLSDAADVPII